MESWKCTGPRLQVQIDSSTKPAAHHAERQEAQQGTSGGRRQTRCLQVLVCVGNLPEATWVSSRAATSASTAPTGGPAYLWSRAMSCGAQKSSHTELCHMILTYMCLLQSTRLAPWIHAPDLARSASRPGAPAYQHGCMASFSESLCIHRLDHRCTGVVQTLLQSRSHGRPCKPSRGTPPHPDCTINKARKQCTVSTQLLHRSVAVPGLQVQINLDCMLARPRACRLALGVSSTRRRSKPSRGRLMPSGRRTGDGQERYGPTKCGPAAAQNLEFHEQCFRGAHSLVSLVNSKVDGAGALPRRRPANAGRGHATTRSTFD